MNKALYKKTSGLVLALIIVASVLFVGFSAPQQAHAGDFEDALEEAGKACATAAAAQAAVNYVLSAIQGTQVPVADVWQQFKNSFLDCMAWATSQAIIQEMTNQTVKWVQTGFDGNPAFVSDYSEWTSEIINREVGAFIEDSSLGFLCSPYQGPIIEAIIYVNQPDRFRDDISCTLDDIVNNTEDFLAGDFRQGGWDGWVKLVHNNPYSEFIRVEAELNSRVAAALDKERTLADWGDGFLSWETLECDGSYETEVDSEGNVIEIPNCQTMINTPGSVIETQLNEQLGSGRRKLEVADEFNEVLTQLLYYYITDLLTEDGGLRLYDPDDGKRDPNLKLPEYDMPDTPGGGGCATCDGEDDVAPGPPGPTYTYNLPGTFHTVTEAEQNKAVSLCVPEGHSYDRVVVSFDVLNAGWNPESRRHNLLWFARERNRDLFGYINFEKPNTLMLRHGIDLAHGDKPIVRVNGNVGPVNTYRVNYIYNTSDELPVAIASIVNAATGQRTEAVLAVQDAITSINVGNKKFVAGFGFTEGEASPDERPGYGWEYRNLEIRFESDENSSTGRQPGCTESVTVHNGSGGGITSDGGGGGGGVEPPGGGIPPFSF